MIWRGSKTIQTDDHREEGHHGPVSTGLAQWTFEVGTSGYSETGVDWRIACTGSLRASEQLNAVGQIIAGREVNRFRTRIREENPIK